MLEHHSLLRELTHAALPSNLSSQEAEQIHSQSISESVHNFHQTSSLLELGLPALRQQLSLYVWCQWAGLGGHCCMVCQLLGGRGSQSILTVAGELLQGSVQSRSRNMQGVRLVLPVICNVWPAVLWACSHCLPHSVIRAAQMFSIS